jgi:exosortase
MSQVLEGTAIQPAKLSEPGAGKSTPIWQIVAIAATIGFLYYEILFKLVSDWWTEPDFSHGFLVPLFSAYVIWTQREKLAQIKQKPSLFGLFVIMGSLAVLVVGVLGAELFLSRTSLIFLLAGLIIFFQGWRFFRAVLFPWAFLFLMVPIPAIIFNQITFPLQLLASKLASVLLPIFGVPVLREGNVIQLPAMPLEVAEACSGIRSLMSLGTLAIVYGYFIEDSNWGRVLLALCSIPIAVAANAGRILGTGLMVQYWDPDKALGFFHEFSGWVIFLISLGLLFATHGLITSAKKHFRKGATA